MPKFESCHAKKPTKRGNGGIGDHPGIDARSPSVKAMPRSIYATPRSLKRKLCTGDSAGADSEIANLVTAATPTSRADTRIRRSKERSTTSFATSRGRATNQANQALPQPGPGAEGRRDSLCQLGRNRNAREMHVLRKLHACQRRTPMRCMPYGSCTPV
jgi:hypothetical protein